MLLIQIRKEVEVSIRSPHRSKGRLWRGVAPEAIIDEFQSAPLTEARGDIVAFLVEVGECPVSIRSPHRSKGRRIWMRSISSSCSVSIRSPHRSKGRHREFGPLIARLKFQSAPLTEARGDIANYLAKYIAKMVSIRSPHRSKGRRSRLSSSCYFGRFQSAPLTEARGDPMHML